MSLTPKRKMEKQTMKGQTEVNLTPKYDIMWYE